MTHIKQDTYNYGSSCMSEFGILLSLDERK